MDEHGNINAKEGIDRCDCGCKYWENDKCIDCGQLVEIIQLRQAAKTHVFLHEMWLNCLVSTTVFYDYNFPNWPGPVVGNTEDIMSKYRKAGVIQ